MDSITLIVTVSLYVLLAPFISNIIRIPITVVEILLGVLGAYFGFLGSNEYFFIIAKVGFLFLMFVAGLEVNLKEFAKLRKDFLLRAALYFTMLYSLALIAYHALSLSPIYIVVLPIFSLGMIMALIKDYGKHQPWLSLALTIGIAGEVISIIAITILTGALSFGFGLQFLKILLTMALFVFVAIGVFKISKTLFWWFPELKLIIIPFQDNKDQDIRFAMALFFGMIAMVLWLRIDMVLGAFFAGIFLSSFFKHKTDLHNKLLSFCFGFFAPIFFIHVGSTLDLNTLFMPQIVKKAMLIVGLIVGIRLIASFVVFYGALKLKNTLLFTLSNSMPLTFMVAVATIGLNAHVISKHEYFSIILASIADAIVVMTVIKLLFNFFNTQKAVSKVQ